MPPEPCPRRRAPGPADGQLPVEWGLDLDLAVVGVFFLNGEERQIGLGKFQLTERMRKA